jgi:hypothetical protein
MRRLLILALAGAALATAPASMAATGCGPAVLKDWADGKLDRTYPVKCYHDALDAMPEDMRSYTTASDDIQRALLARLRATRTHHGALRGRAARKVMAAPRTTAREALSAAGVTTRATGIPLPLIVIAVVGLALLLAGSAGLLGRFRAARHSRA